MRANASLVNRSLCLDEGVTNMGYRAPAERWDERLHRDAIRLFFKNL